MMRINFYKLACVALIIVASCGHRENGKNDGGIDVASAFSTLTPLKASDYFQQIRYIPLETTDDCLIGNNPDIQLLNDKIVVTTRKQCFLFDKETGRFLRSIGQVGNGPEDYHDADCWINSRTEKIYFNGTYGKLICYDTNNHFEGAAHLPVASGLISAFIPNAYSGLDAETVVFHANAAVQLLFLNLAGDTLGVIRNQQAPPALDVSSISGIDVLKTGDASVIVISDQDPDTGYIAFVSETHFWHLGEKTFFKESFNDTIYQVMDKTLIPHTVFNLGKYHWDDADKNKRSGEKRIYIDQIIENEDVMYFSFVINLLGEKGSSLVSYNAFLNKATRELRINGYDEGMENDVAHFLPLQPRAVSPAGEFAGLIPADKIVTWFDENKPESLSKEIAPLKKVVEDDNPVIVLFN